MKNEGGELIEDEGFEEKVGTTGNNGILEFNDITYGTYRLYETKAPEGYNLLNESIEIVVDSDTIPEDKIVKMQVKNIEKLVLPETGGIGTLIFIVIGIALISICKGKRLTNIAVNAIKNRLK